MNTVRPVVIATTAAVLAAIGLSGCSSSSSDPTPAVTTSTGPAMMSESAKPSGAMMSESPSPSGAMMEKSATPSSSAMMEASTNPSGDAMMSESPAP